MIHGFAICPAQFFCKGRGMVTVQGCSTLGADYKGHGVLRLCSHWADEGMDGTCLCSSDLLAFPEETVYLHGVSLQACTTQRGSVGPLASVPRYRVCLMNLGVVRLMIHWCIVPSCHVPPMPLWTAGWLPSGKGKPGIPQHQHAYISLPANLRDMHVPVSS